MSKIAPHWEKSGNTAWVGCSACSKWFPVSGELIDAKTIKLVCPHCLAQFAPADAREIHRP